MKDDYSEIIVNRILSLCKQRDISIYQLSIMSGVSHSTIDNLVNRKTYNRKSKRSIKLPWRLDLLWPNWLTFLS